LDRRLLGSGPAWTRWRTEKTQPLAEIESR